MATVWAINDKGKLFGLDTIFHSISHRHQGEDIFAVIPANTPNN